MLAQVSQPRVADGDGEMILESEPGSKLAGARCGVEVQWGAVRVQVDWDGNLVELPVVELALDELVIRPFTPANVDLRWHPGRLRIDACGTDIACEVSVRALADDREARTARLLVHTPADQRPALVRAYHRFRFPRLCGRGELDPADVIELVRASRYLDLRPSDQPPSESWCRPEFAGELSVDSVYRSADEVLLGHVSVTRAYSRTWLGHQLLTIKGHPESAECRVALYNHFASVPTTMDGHDDVFLLGYFDRSLRWHQLLFEGFVEWIGDPRLVAVVPFDRFEPSLSADPPGSSSSAPDPADDVVIEPASADDIPTAVELVRAQLSELAVEAFDIDVERLASSHLHEQYARRGVERGRRVLIARECGVIVGVALCETGSRNLSLFNLFNLAQVYATDQISRAAHAELFRAARRFYTERGIHDPVIVAPPRRFRTPADAGLRLDETMGCIVWSARSLEQYPSYVRACFEQIDAASLTKAS